MHRTTIRLDEHLLVQVKAHAVERRVSLTAVIEEALRTHLARSSSATNPRRRRVKFPSFKGAGYAPGNKTWDDVRRVIEEEDIENHKRVTREDAARRR
jgi:hypothetical protein